MNQNTKINQKTLSRAFYEVMSDLSKSDEDPIILGWRDRESQTSRFDVFVDSCVKSGDNIMDFGCGTADLYGYLKDRDIIVDYTGIDIMSDFIKTAKDRYDEKITILDTNVLYYMEKFDWYFASGVFSVGFDIESITEHIKHFVHSSNKGVCFNLLNKETFSGDVQVSFLPLEVKSMYVDLFPKHDVEVVSDYSDDDFTIIIRQK